MIGSVFSRIAATLLCACLRALSKKTVGDQRYAAAFFF
ncbi:Uncharacterised protein [Klebsiella pneumoniae subsp. ozaenae]|uniref:Uncharacterized protein n=1 Tax=Klebsiella pneumoniae subsp. ozaenae TaxID=574 RepID=A0A377Z901_KLEPO|nr:Uncharacterised protein [Klebsiella pneumoniae subsp. ozaenae]